MSHVDRTESSTDVSPTADAYADGATRELAEVFARALVDGDRDQLASVLGERVTSLVPGRSSVAGLHRDRTATLDALSAAPAPGIDVDDAEITEVMSDGRRALVVIAMSGSAADGRFGVEVAFHLQTDGESIIGVTEYSGDQHLIDELLGVPSAPPSLSARAAIEPRAWASQRRARWWQRRHG